MPMRKAQFLERFVAKLCINTIKITLPTDKFQCHFSWQDVEYCLQVLSQSRLKMHQHCVIMLSMILNNLQINLFVFANKPSHAVISFLNKKIYRLFHEWSTILLVSHSKSTNNKKFFYLSMHLIRCYSNRSITNKWFVSIFIYIKVFKNKRLSLQLKMLPLDCHCYLHPSLVL